MSRRTKVAIAYTILMLIVSGVLRLVGGRDNWLDEAIASAITFGFGIALGYSEGMRD